MTYTLLTSEGLTGLIFLIFAVTTIAGALIATNSSGLVRSVAGLAMCFIGVAGLYFFLAAPFVALLQILIYVGAVCVTIIFAVMLANTSEVKDGEKKSFLKTSACFLICTMITISLISLSIKTYWTTGPNIKASGSVESIGQALLTTYSMSFELISIVLLVAIVGSLVLAKSGRKRT